MTDSSEAYALLRDRWQDQHEAAWEKALVDGLNSMSRYRKQPALVRLGIASHLRRVVVWWRL